MKFTLVLCALLFAAPSAFSMAVAGDNEVCWRHLIDWDLVPGLMTGGPGVDDRNNTFFFGNFGADEDLCAEACAAHPECYSYTLPFPAGAWIDMGEDPAWQGLCMGRSISPNVSTRFPDINAGVKIPCVEPPEDEVKILSQSNSIMGWKAAPAPPATFTDIVLDDCPSLFVAVEGLTGYENTVSFQIPDNDDLYVRLHEGALVLESKLYARSPELFAAEATFYLWPSGARGSTAYALEVFENYDQFVASADGVALSAGADSTDKEHFYFIEQ